MRRSRLLLPLLLLAPVAACSGDDDGGDDDTAATSTTAAESTTTTEGSEAASGPTADAYAEGVCSSIGAWYDRIDTASTELVEEAGSLGQEDPTAGKDLVLGFLDDAIGFTDDLIGELEGAGVPDTEAGAETADQLVAGIGDVRELFSGARDDTAALPEDDPQALATGLQEIGASLQDSATAVGSSFEEVLGSVEDPELDEAFESAASCRELATVG